MFLGNSVFCAAGLVQILFQLVNPVCFYSVKTPDSPSKLYFTWPTCNGLRCAQLLLRSFASTPPKPPHPPMWSVCVCQCVFGVKEGSFDLLCSQPREGEIILQTRNGGSTVGSKGPRTQRGPYLRGEALVVLLTFCSLGRPCYETLLFWRGEPESMGISWSDEVKFTSYSFTWTLVLEQSSGLWKDVSLPAPGLTSVCFTGVHLGVFFLFIPGESLPLSYLIAPSSFILPSLGPFLYPGGEGGAQVQKETKKTQCQVFVGSLENYTAVQQTPRSWLSFIPVTGAPFLDDPPHKHTWKHPELISTSC